MTDIVIDSEFKNLIPPLQDDEYTQLEASILADGCRDAIVIWKGENIIVDGHNRYDICSKHNIDYRTTEREFENRDAVIVWMINNQFSRRNISTFVRAELALKLKAVFSKQAKENQATFYGNQHTGLLTKSTKVQEINTRKELAKKAETSEDTIRKVEKITQRTTPKIIKEKARKGEISINRADKLTRALEKSPLGYIDKIIELSDDNDEKVLILNRLHKSMGSPETNGTFQEIIDTGGFAYGDEMQKWCDYKPSTVEQINKALRSIAEYHKAEAIKLKMANAEHARAILHSSDNNEWYTPKEYVDAAHLVMGGIDLDPASNIIANEVVRATSFYDISTNGFNKRWEGRIWLNPPYGKDGGISNQEKWVSRLLEQYKADITNEAILLVNAVTDRKWFQPLWSYTICFTDHRVKFYDIDGNPGQPTHGNAFVYLGNNTSGFIHHFSQFGVVVQRLYAESQLEAVA